MSFNAKPDALLGKVILVSGASDGIGRCAAIEYAKRGADIILIGRNRQKLEQTTQAIAPFHVKTLSIVLDLANANATDFKQLAAQIETQWHRLDGALLNAGILGELAPIAEIAIDDFDQVMQINVRSQLLMIQVLLPLLLASASSSLILTSSGVGRYGRATWGSYAISKFATEGLMQTLADEMKTTSLRVNCINPGATRTHMRAQAKPEEDPHTLKTPLEIMPTYLFLMADESQSVTGMSLDAQIR
ncbi:YciK family oxidoreductase [Celerinatantimonas sp. YJH-8]|uniref:YciK family oxidoreductase n=1 Tax=Celerinatantimonas sp. YJH-8 TaxID=3228714 RepID=UPI0038CBF584